MSFKDLLFSAAMVAIATSILTLLCLTMAGGKF
jgi:hypothetical protein